jgi:Ca2+-binding RTX toxin-like protein
MVRVLVDSARSSWRNLGVSISLADIDRVIVMTISGTGGNDNCQGTAGTDTFDMTQGGDDVAMGRDGDDAFFFGAALTANDRINGGAGTDALVLDGDYAIAIQFVDTTLRNIERIVLVAGHSYSISGADGNVASGTQLIVDGWNLGVADSLVWDGSAERNGHFQILGGAGSDVLIGGAGDDTINDGAYTGNDSLWGNAGDDLLIAGGGTDEISGGAGDDRIMLADFDATDAIDGGHGQDTLVIGYSAGFVALTASSLSGIERIVLQPGHSFAIQPDEQSVAKGQLLAVDARALDRNYGLTWFGSAETDGHFYVFGGSGDDVLQGGAKSDTLVGGRGNDTLTGGPGDDIINGNGGDDIIAGGVGSDILSGGGKRDIFVYDDISESAGGAYDTIAGFNARYDLFDTFIKVEGVDPRVHGSLSSATFQSDLIRALGDGQLAPHHAVVFKASAGDQAGDLFLAIDANGAAGYQRGQDLLIRLADAYDISDLSTANFI